MTTPPPGPAAPEPSRKLEALVLAVAFALAHTQGPVPYSNQNQYLLHGAALAGHGHLAADWLTSTPDPTPLFSLLVAAAYSVHAWLLQPAYALLLMAYFLATRATVARLPGFPDTRPARLVFAALFIAAHAAVLRWLSVQAVGVDYPWYLRAGVAAQYLLGPGIQPSAFGVLLAVAVACFANGRPVLACGVAVGTCWLHATYLLPAGLLVGGFVVAGLWAGRGARLPVAVGALMVVPPLAYALTFQAGDAGDARRILADVRIPHHCRPAQWFDPVAGFQVGWAAAGVWLVRRTPLGVALGVAAAGAAVLTVVQVATGSRLLALAFPWRISVLLVPLATAVVIARGLAWKPPGPRAARAAVVALVLLAAGGLVVMVGGLGYRTVDESGIYEHVRTTAGPGDVYLIPTAFPSVGSRRGAVSNTFAPPARAADGGSQIPVDLQQFRLATGARLFVDFKSVPYTPAELREWNERMEFASRFYATDGRGGTADDLKGRGITHVIASRARPFGAAYLKPVYADEAYIVYRVE